MEINNLVVIQLLGLINPEFDQMEMTLDDIRYLNDPIVQIAIRKIKLLCFKYAMSNKLDSEKFKYEINLVIMGFNQEKRKYLENYVIDLSNKMEDVISPKELNENLDSKWHWGDEIAPSR